MPNTYSKIYLHCIWAVKYRQALILPSFEEELHKYITGIVKGQGHFVVAINGMPDHIHLLIRLRPRMAISNLIQHIKRDSSRFVNQKGFLNAHFKWQVGSAIFSVSERHVERVINYIRRQKEHHKIKTFRQEYLRLLEENEISYNSEYLPEFFDLTRGIPEQKYR